MDRSDIIIPVWDQLEATAECIDSILRNTNRPYRLIVIDNGSAPDTRGYLERLKNKYGLDVRLVRNEKNLGFVRAVNQGLAASEAPYICVMNNDTVAASGWLEEMISVMQRHPEVGILNPSSNTFGDVPGPGSVEEHASQLKRYAGLIQELYTCRGFCMLLRRRVFEALAGFDESYTIGYFEETDYCMRAQRAGFRIARALGSYVYHKERVSFNALKESGGLFEKNEKIFFERWPRPIRVAYLVDGSGREDKVDIISSGIARMGHQVLIFLKKGLGWPVKLDHFDIRRVDIGALFFPFVSVCKIFARRKKKKIDVIFVDNAALGLFMNICRFLHGSAVFTDPQPDKLPKALVSRSAGAANSGER